MDNDKEASGSPPRRGPSLVSQVRTVLRTKHYSRRTEVAYLGWIRRFIRYHGTRHPSALGVTDVRDFISSLAIRDGVSASTQNQATAALSFLYRDVLGAPLEAVGEVMRAKRPHRMPVVLTRGEVDEVLERMRGPGLLVASLLYGSGLRLMEAMTLRVKDLDFAQGAILVRGGKGAKDRITMLPAAFADPLQRHLSRVRATHQRDSPPVAGGSSSPTRLRANSPVTRPAGPGNGSFPQRAATPTPSPANRAATTCMSPRFSAPCTTPSSPPVSPSARAATPSVTRSRPTSSRTATTSGRCRSSSATATWRRR